MSPVSTNVKLKEGLALKSSGKYKEAASRLEEALTIMRSNGEGPESMVDALVNLSEVYIRLTDLDRCYRAAKEAVEVASRPRIGALVRGKAQLQMGASLLVLRRNREAVGHLEKSLSLLETAKDDIYIARACRSLGNANLVRCEYGKAVAYYTRAMKLFEKLGMDKDKNYTLYNIVLVKRNMGYYKEALAEVDGILAFFKGSKDQSAIGRSISTKGEIYLFMGQWLDSQRCYEEAMEHAKLIGDRMSYVYSVDGKVEALLGRGCIGEAEALLDEVLQEVLKSGLEDQRGTIFRLKGAIKRERGEFKAAYDDLAVSEKLLKQTEPTIALALTYIDWALAYAKEGEDIKAGRMFDKAASVYDTLNLTKRKDEVERARVRWLCAKGPRKGKG